MPKVLSRSVLPAILAVLLCAFLSASFEAQAQPNRHSADYKNRSSVYYPVSVRGKSYYYRSGLYYVRQGNRYRVINPPIGARVGFLPESAISLSVGPHKYFRVGLTWYLHRHRDGKDEYEVVEKPESAKEENTYEEQQPILVIYPAAGQSADQQNKDEYECYRWAKDQSGFDPTLANQDLAKKDLYQRAMSACLEARDYTVK